MNDQITLATQSERFRRAIQDYLEGKEVTIEGGEYNGKIMVKLSDVTSAIWGTETPPPSTHAAEVLTPARVVVWARCPVCSMPGTIAVHLEPQLTVDSTGRVLKVTAKSKAASHVCGQTSFDVPSDVVEGQIGLDEASEDSEADLERSDEDDERALADVDEEVLVAVEVVDPDGDLLPEGTSNFCDYPNCVRVLGHRGDHKIAKDAD